MSGNRYVTVKLTPADVADVRIARGAREAWYAGLNGDPLAMLNDEATRLRVSLLLTELADMCDLPVDEDPEL